MQHPHRRPIAFALASCLSLLAAGLTAQPPESPAAPQRATPKRIGDPYALAVCPISSKKLGSMGDPIVKLYEGREVRFCCDGCPPTFEKDLPASLAKLDEKIVKDQAPLYPLKTSVVTGAALPEKPYELVLGNRLFRLGDEREKAEIQREPGKYLEALNKAVVAAQGEHYVLSKCPVSGEDFGGDMGEPVDVVVAGRLVRLCCKMCLKDVEKAPARFVAMVDEARKAAAPAPGR